MTVTTDKVRDDSNRVRDDSNKVREQVTLLTYPAIAIIGKDANNTTVSCQD